MQSPSPMNKNFRTLVEEVKSGQIKIPQFQRDFVWNIEKSAKLIDSILKGYPIGSFIFWRTNERLRSLRNIGGIKLPEPKTGEYVDYVLDGQQRLTSIIAVLLGEIIYRLNGNPESFEDVYVDLYKDINSEDDEQIVTVGSKNAEEYKHPNYISVKDLVFGDFDFLASFPQKQKDKIRNYKNMIENYQFSIIEIKDAPLDVATEVFSRINIGGKELTLFEIMVAKTYDPGRNFDLSEKYDELMDNLKNINYETISKSTVLQVASVILNEENHCTKKAVLNLNKDEFIKNWGLVVNSLEKACDYLRDTIRIPVSELLPYSAIVVVLSYFFYKHENKPTDEMSKYLQDYFWRCSIGKRYTTGPDTKIPTDIKKMDRILAKQKPTYDWTIDTSVNYIVENGEFGTGNSYIKGLICLLAYQEPKSFNSNSIVRIGNDWLKQANSKNYHHFFPKSYLKKKNIYEDKKINHILNITIVDDFLNKREIKDRAPSDYINDYKNNKGLAETLKTHLIGDMDVFGVKSDDYDKFFKKRALLFSEELEKRIID